MLHSSLTLHCYEGLHCFDLQQVPGPVVAAAVEDASVEGNLREHLSRQQTVRPTLHFVGDDQIGMSMYNPSHKVMHACDKKWARHAAGVYTCTLPL